MTARSATACLCLLALLASAATHAIEYDRLVAEASKLTFAYRQMGVPMEGRFARFEAQIAFDPERPERGRATLEVDLGSIDTGLAEANDTARGRPFFDVKNHPRARFVATGMRALGGDRFEVTGELTIKGRTRTVSAPFTLRRVGERAVVTGAFAIKRLQFGIGEGAWADLSALADEVEVRFELAATPTAAANRKGNAK